ncbi:MAG: hypothetical protein DRH37_11870 [Deltaproteobacteria bacterium]|nr:MAG: hypothetical protein DRH37_11870 [Deltaproteobacteria bacterium]
MTETIKQTRDKKTYIETWLSDASGDASVTFTPTDIQSLLKVQTVPGEDGDLTTDLPTGYDIEINDIYGEDIMDSDLANCSGTVAKSFHSSPEFISSGALTIVVSNAGNAKQGIVILTFRKESRI